MKVHNGDLYVGGIFQRNTGAPGNGIAKWNGSKWSNLGQGLGAKHNWVYSILFKGDIMNLAGNFEVDNVVHTPFVRFIGGQFCYDTDTVMWQGYCLEMLNDKVYLGGQGI